MVSKYFLHILHLNGKTFQKIAEFNAVREEYANKSDKDIILTF